jgi:hypothetical protein
LYRRSSGSAELLPDSKASGASVYAVDSTAGWGAAAVAACAGLRAACCGSVRGRGSKNESKNRRIPVVRGRSDLGCVMRSFAVVFKATAQPYAMKPQAHVHKMFSLPCYLAYRQVHDSANTPRYVITWYTCTAGNTAISASATSTIEVNNRLSWKTTVCRALVFWLCTARPHAAGAHAGSSHGCSTVLQSRHCSHAIAAATPAAKVALLC